jgi:hypothetical protein
MSSRTGLWDLLHNVWGNLIAAAIIAVLASLTFLPQLESLSLWLRVAAAAALGTLLMIPLLLLLWRYLRRTPKTLVFLSSGGTCRDPMAKAIAIKLLEAHKPKYPITIRAAGLALLWQILLMLLSDADPSSAVRASLKRPNYEVDDGVAHGWQAWLRRWPVDSFFPVSLLRDGDAGGRRKRSLS